MIPQYIIDQYIEKTGIHPDLVIINVLPKDLDLYERAVCKFEEIKILDSSFNVFGDVIPEKRAIVFKNKHDMPTQLAFLKECRRLRRLDSMKGKLK